MPIFCQLYSLLFLLFNFSLDALAINAQDINGDTALHRAVRSMDGERVKRLLECDETNPNITNNDQKTPLELSYEKAKESRDLDTRNRCIAPLLAILATGRVDDAIKKNILLDLLNCKGSEWLPYYMPIKQLATSKELAKLPGLINFFIEKKLPIAKTLLSYIEDYNAEYPDFGGSPLEKAITSGMDSVAELLIREWKANISCANSNGDTPLHLAAKCGNALLVELLLEQGADGNHCNNAGRTPLHDAQESCIAPLCGALRSSTTIKSAASIAHIE